MLLPANNVKPYTSLTRISISELFSSSVAHLHPHRRLTSCFFLRAKHRVFPGNLVHIIASSGTQHTHTVAHTHHHQSLVYFRNIRKWRAGGAPVIEHLFYEYCAQTVFGGKVATQSTVGGDRNETKFHSGF